MKPIKYARYLPSIAMGLLVLILFGCGGGHSSQSATGRAVFTLVWPARTKLIPLASNSIRVTLQNSVGTVLGDKVIARPPDGGQSTADFTGLKPGATTIASATAYPNADATGTAQATATIPINVLPDVTTNVDLTMESTISRLEISPANPAVLARAATNLSVTAYNASNQVVLVTPGKITWKSGSTGIATIDSTGKVSGLEIGTSTITVTDTESSKFGTATLTVNPSALANTAWPKFRAGYRNSGVGVGSGAGNNILWQFTPGTYTAGVALGPDGTLYFGTFVNNLNANLYAIDPATHAPKWTFQVLGGVHGTPLLGQDGNLYFGSTLGRFYSVNSQTGTQNWAFDFTGGGFLGSAAMGPDGTVYAPDGSGRVFALNPRTGVPKWTFHSASDGSLTTAPAIGADGTVYVCDYFHGYYALDPATGSVLWNFAPADGQFAIAAPVVAPNGNIIVSFGNKKLYSLNPSTGVPDWSFTGEYITDVTPVVDSAGNIYTGYTTGTGLNTAGASLTKLGSDGSVKWQKQGAYAPMGIDGAGVLYALKDPWGPNQLVAIDSRTSATNWTLPMAVGFDIAIAANGTLYVNGNTQITAVR